MYITRVIFYQFWNHPKRQRRWFRNWWKMTRVIYPKSREQSCDSWFSSFTLIKTKQSRPQLQIIGMITKQMVITKQRDDYNVINWHRVYGYTHKYDHTFTDKHLTITSRMSNQKDDYKSAVWLQNRGWLQNNQLT